MVKAEAENDIKKFRATNNISWSGNTNSHEKYKFGCAIRDNSGFVEYLESNDIGFYSKDYDAHWVWLDEIFDDINTEEEKACVAMAVLKRLILNKIGATMVSKGKENE